ncbi:RNA polymerase sigma-70 factor (ECF subfamily) [Chitinophaga skermanii]|uniref:RNA polymerase sigma-70 factor (ECF subfamily) n=1 Tax=Chitinophaga skermanii TaxID=331697 RepID=A0A327QYW5_9BACT|nr:sigma-70 family RNA polymerase sigma factor [Chitinophaga skermanii]RAJ06857.1 RNA polymerase sigma-70 factor (ECF subfamily) [Chitinophaga skermanii]
MNYPNAQHLSDIELIQRYKTDGNSDWIGVLFDRYAILLLGLCMKYLKNEEDARDSVQQIFLKVLQEVHKHDIIFFKAWIHQVAKNYCLMQLRKTQQHVQTELTEVNMPGVADIEDDQKAKHIEKDNMLEHMQEGLAQLNIEQSTCVKLFYLDKKSYQEIADITGYSLLQVKSYIQNGKRNLKLFLEKFSTKS